MNTLCNLLLYLSGFVNSDEDSDDGFVMVAGNQEEEDSNSSHETRDSLEGDLPTPVVRPGNASNTGPATAARQRRPPSPIQVS